MRMSYAASATNGGSMHMKNTVKAHRHSIQHREEVLGSELCGCFYCLHIFPPSEIVRWCDGEKEMGATALCPQCGIDSVIGAKSGYDITKDFLQKMHDHWF